MEETYKDWKIKYIEDGTKPRFEATKDGHVMKSIVSLRDLKHRIDTYVKEEFTRTPVYYHNYSHIQEADITSIAEEDTNGKISELWIVITNSNGTKTRQKERLNFTNRLYKKNEHNKKIFDEIKQLTQTISELQNKINTLEDGLEAFDAQTLKKKEEKIL